MGKFAFTTYNRSGYCDGFFDPLDRGYPCRSVDRVFRIPLVLWVERYERRIVISLCGLLGLAPSIAIIRAYRLYVVVSLLRIYPCPIDRPRRRLYFHGRSTSSWTRGTPPLPGQSYHTRTNPLDVGRVYRCGHHWLRFVCDTRNCLRRKSSIPDQISLTPLAAINMAVFQFRTIRAIVDWDTQPITPIEAKVAGAMSLLLWMGVLLAGRWTGHII